MILTLSNPFDVLCMEVEIRHFHSPAYLKFMKISVTKEKEDQETGPRNS